MAWFFVGLFVYYLVLLSEQVLLGLSPHDLERLRTEGPAAAGRLTARMRHSLAALLLARILLKIILCVALAIQLTQSIAIRDWLAAASRQSALPAGLVWGLAGAGLALALATLFWSLKKIWRPAVVGRRARILLRALTPFIRFWNILFAWVLPREKRENAGPENEGRTPSPNVLPGFAAEKHRDIELLKSIVKFSDVTVKQVMQPRSKVVAVDFRTGFGDLLNTVREAGFSRMPVYDEDLDNVTGILYVKDLVPYLDKTADFEWQPLIRTDVLLVPEAKRISELLQEFKRNRLHMAIVVDEYGGSSGIVTMEDILEEITGEIRDEFDEESEIRYRKIDDNNYLFEGQTLLNDVCRITGLDPGAFDEVRGAADTLAGLALELKGDIPKPGAELRWNNYLLTVVAADNRRIQQVKLTLQ